MRIGGESTARSSGRGPRYEAQAQSADNRKPQEEKIQPPNTVRHRKPFARRLAKQRVTPLARRRQGARTAWPFVTIPDQGQGGSGPGRRPALAAGCRVRPAEPGDCIARPFETRHAASDAGVLSPAAGLVAEALRVGDLQSLVSCAGSETVGLRVASCVMKDTELEKL